MCALSRKSGKDENTRKRELRAFQKTIDELNLSKNISCLIISEDKSTNIEFGDININNINVIEWLLDCK